MSKKRPDSEREYDKRYYQLNKEREAEKAATRRKKIRDLLNDIKSTRGCLRCGEEEPIALDFHHLDPETKSFNISQNSHKTVERLLEEISKCVVLCANCHRKLHADLWSLEEYYNAV